MKLATLIAWFISPHDTHVVTLTVPEEQCGRQAVMMMATFIPEHSVRAWCVPQPSPTKEPVK